MTNDLLKIEQLSCYFPLDRHHAIRAVDGVSFSVRHGEIFGLVGESGSGKSTLARCVMGLYRPQQGHIYFDGLDTTRRLLSHADRIRLQKERQLIFQDSSSSLNSRMKIADIIAEPMLIHHIRPPRGSLRAEAAFQLHYVGLDESYLDKYPPELSGGQRQRVAIARALSMNPRLLIADEPIASLDVSIQAQIVNLFEHLRQEHGFSILFIAHDLAMVEYLCDRVGVMYQGSLVELAPVRELFGNPCHAYTKALLSAIPQPDPLSERKKTILRADAEGFVRDGVFTELEPGHFVLMKEAAQ